MIKRVLVTGHKGFIGSHVYELLKSKYETVDGYDVQDGMLRQFHLAPPDYDVVVHCAASVSVTESVEDPEMYVDNNVGALAKYLKKLQEFSPSTKFIFLSTGAVYGERLHAHEHANINYLHNCKSPYAMTKLVGEWLVRHYMQNHLILRLSNVTGEGQDNRGEPNCMTHFAKDDPITVYGGEQTRDFVDVDVVAEAIYRGIKKSTKGTYNISSDTEVSVLDIAKRYANERGVKYYIKPPRDGEVDYISLDNTRAIKAGLLDY